MPLTMVFSLTMSAMQMAGWPVLPVLASARSSAALLSSSRSSVPGFTNDAPGRCRPMISISIWLLLAVP
ncbi:hypothetical protein FQZ97_1157230 [compost metagenome]